jgi:hypothetical protein
MLARLRPHLPLGAQLQRSNQGLQTSPSHRQRKHSNYERFGASTDPNAGFGWICTDTTPNLGNQA